jgi:hypothetical protein
VPTQSPAVARRCHPDPVDASQQTLYELLFDRLAADGVADDVADVVLAGYESDAALQRVLSGVGHPAADAPWARPAHDLPGVY